MLIPDEVVINLGTTAILELPILTLNGMDEHLVRQFERDVVTFLRAHDLLKKVVPRPYERNGRYFTAIVLSAVNATLTLVENP